MIKTLSRSGNSLALVIDKPILELLKIDADTKIEITTDGKSLTLTPCAPDPVASRIALLSAAKERMHARYAETFRRLA